ncbi:MAG: CHAT domain-containing protein [Nitrospirota bacterium]
MIEQLRKLLQDPKSTHYPEPSQRLYQRLIKPVEHLINTQRLIIVPHGILHYLPFNALNSGSNYLIDKYSVSYLPSASIMKFLKQKKTQKTYGALIFGNPDLGNPKYDLKHAGEEAVAISKEFSQAKVLLRKEATETDFKKSANQFNYIHFATHGMFESDSPLNSGLFLSKDAENDGLLSVNELYSLSLNADLVTLSACETALGKINPGDDVVGLQRGFLYAGANSIIASLWKVDDMATSYLMTGFYSNLKKINKRDALREAQLTIKKQYEHPYYWAAFQLTGMPE